MDDVVDTTTNVKHFIKKGRRICLFVPYANIINVKLHVVEEGVALNEVWRLEWCKAR